MFRDDLECDKLLPFTTQPIRQRANYSTNQSSLLRAYGMAQLPPLLPTGLTGAGGNSHSIRWQSVIT